MSKTNPVKTTALNTPVKETNPAKPVATKTVSTKASAVKPVVAKVTANATAKKVVAEKTEPAKVVKTVKEKTPKLKMERDSFTMPKAEYAQLNVLKDRLEKLNQPAKKSELLRAGIMQLSAMTDAALKAALSKVPTIKTGRPKKK